MTTAEKTQASAHVCTPPQTPSEYVARLPAWDGKHRLDNWITRVLKKNNDEHTPDLAAIGSVFIQDMVSRALPPLFSVCGEQLQGPGDPSPYLLLLAGPMGTRKSTVLETLAGKWFNDSNVLDDYEPDVALEGAWLHEISEFGFGLSPSPEFKAFATRTHYHRRRPYESQLDLIPRTVMLAATTSSEAAGDSASDWIWTVTLTREKADIEWLSSNRDQLFSEAKERLGELPSMEAQPC